MYPISAKRRSASLRVWPSTMAALSSATAEDLRLAKADCRLRVALSSSPAVTSTPLSADGFCSMVRVWWCVFFLSFFLAEVRGFERKRNED